MKITPISRGRILVVEDEPGQNRMFCRTLAKEGYATEGVASAHKARRKIRQKKFDLILLDLVLKTDRDGMDLLQFIRNDPRLRHIPVIAMTGYGSALPILAEAIALGAKDGLPKPIFREHLIKKVARYIAEARKAPNGEDSKKPPAVDFGKVRTRVLVVEDDASMQDFYEGFFETMYGKEFSCILIGSGEQAIQELQRHPSPPIDIVLLDWSLPGMDGFEVLRFIRSNPSTRTVLAVMLTGNDSEDDVIAALDAGTDEYLVKPISERELYSRLCNLLDRRDLTLKKHGIHERDGLALDIKSRQAALDGKVIQLHPKESALLQVFLQRPDVIHSAQYLWETIWGRKCRLRPRALRKQISNLRTRLGAWGARIEARWGQGYMLNTRFPALQG